MKKLLISLFIIFSFFTVNAQDFNVTSTITAPTGGGASGTYTATEIYNTGTTNYYYVNTRYNGRLSRIRFNIPIPSTWPDGDCFSSGDLSYTLTLNMATNDWRNYFARPFISSSSSGVNWSSGSITFVSRKQIKFNFKIPATSNCYDFLYVNLTSPNESSTAFTGETNWNLSSIILTANFPTSGSGSGSGGSGSESGSGSSSDATNQDIINSNSQNTQDIIDNNSQNTQDIIENNNDNTQQIIENNNKNTKEIVESNYNCKDYDKDSIDYDNRYLTSNGSIASNSAFGMVLFLPIFEDSLIKVLIARSGAASTCFYSDNNINSLISCTTGNEMTVNEYLTIPKTAKYVMFSINKNDNAPTFRVCNKSSEELNSSITNSNIDSNLGSGFFDNFTSQDFGLSQIITIPLNTIQSLTSKSCVPLQVPIPFTNSNINLPCMTEIYQTKFSSIYNLWKIVSFGIVAYLIAIDIFHIVKGFKDPESDKVEVLDL